MDFLQDLSLIDLLFLAWLAIHFVIGWFGKLWQGLVLVLMFSVSTYLINNQLGGLSSAMSGFIKNEEFRLIATYIVLFAGVYLLGSFLNMYIRSVSKVGSKGFISMITNSVGGAILYVLVGCFTIFHFYNFITVFYPNSLSWTKNSLSYQLFLQSSTFF
ncbi:MAG: CvpA family protein [SAR324 cluster bacterium]|nr:CvpA family protein [SAR324 cluster bacterium]